ncbi:MAG TPA: MG2 domain-containing protein [Pyrinomonadaceae bacterium]|nr:MG2 domain-containing protein [Pyrinomonadaceae bacterium]
MLQLRPHRRLNQERRRAFKATVTYLLVIVAAFAFNLYRLRAQQQQQEKTRPESEATGQTDAAEEANPDAKPFFSLTTNRTFATTERARLWASFQGVDHLDFRVYRVNDPVKFFQQLDDPHQVGEHEKEELESDYSRKLQVMERTRSLKNWIYAAIREYVRQQLRRDHRQAFNQKFRAGSVSQRTPLNVADYARVPLLNPSQLVSSWREKLPSTEVKYDGVTISLGRREPGVYLVEAVNGELRAYCVAIVTELTMVQKTTNNGEVMAFIVDRKTGEPRAGVRVVLLRDRETLASGTTDPAGIFKTEVEKKAQAPGADENVEGEDSHRDSYLMMASDRDSFAISDLDSFYFGAYGEDYDPSLTGYIYTDRPVYRPEQKVYFKGILRRWARSGYEMVGGASVDVKIEDFNGGKIFEQSLALSSRGTFAGEVDIPAEAPLGTYQITASMGTSTASHYFTVQEYKKPEYKVTVKGPKQFVAVGERVRFSVDARYFFGSPVARADVKYYIYRSRYYHYWRGETDADDGADDSELMNDGGEDEDGGGDDYEGYGGNDIADEGEGTLDAQGHLAVDFEVPPPDEWDEWDYTYRFEAQVTDGARRQMQASASFTGTRGRAIASAQPERYIYYQGDQARIIVRTADYLGHPVPAKVTLKFIEHDWERVEKDNGDGGTYTDYELRTRELATAYVQTGAQGYSTYDYTVPTSGSIYLKAILHEDGREVTSPGGSFWSPARKGELGDLSFRDYGESTIKLIPDKKSYKAGETAHVLAVLPSDDAHLLVTTELASILSARRLDSPGRTLVIDVPIESRYEPNVYLSVAYVKNDELYTGERFLAVPARDKFLQVEIIPNKAEYKPRETASYTILARNRDGSPASGAEVSLGVVDEAVYSIMPENAGDIRREFYGRRYNEVETRLATVYAFTGYSGAGRVQLAAAKPSYQLADFKNESEFAEPTVRREFKDTAFWQPDVITGADGRATVTVKLPDNLTTWRATVRAVTADTRVGSAVEKVVSRKDVIMRLAMPRFLTEGDTVTISGIVHNFLKTTKTTRISIAVSGAQLLGPSLETVTIPRMGQHRVDWRVRAPQAGQLRLLAKALTDTESDAVEQTMEVVPHGLKQTMGGVTTISEEAADKTIVLDLPAHPDAQARRLRIEASPSVASTLFGALDYLTAFPYGCTEQTMSSFLPDVIVAQALRDVQTARIREGNDLGLKVGRGLNRLYGFQHEDGGWGWWKSDESDAFMTAYVVDGLTLARRAGFEVDQWRIDRGRERLKQMIDRGATAARGDEEKLPDTETRAYMVYALIESGDADSSYVEELYAGRGSLQPYGRALLALALFTRGDEHRARTVATEIEASARANDFEARWESRFKSHYGYEQVMDTEATALSLKALALISPQSELLPKVARWLVASRGHGYYWISTRETAFAIFGLTEYLKVSRELTPDYTLEVYVNDEPVITRRVTSADVSAAQTFVVERKGQAVTSANRVRIVKRGTGVVYLSTTLEYYTGGEEVAAQASTELRLAREYLRLRVTEDENGKSGWTLEPLAGELRSGDLIVSRLRVEGARAQYLMIEDPIPAGCVQVASTSGINLNYTEGRWSDWYSAREFRDQRTVFFLSYFDGSATFQYAMRVEVPGAFRVAPARAELMYQPTVQANTANTRLDILDKK